MGVCINIQTLIIFEMPAFPISFISVMLPNDCVFFQQAYFHAIPHLCQMSRGSTRQSPSRIHSLELIRSSFPAHRTWNLSSFIIKPTFSIIKLSRENGHDTSSASMLMKAHIEHNYFEIQNKLFILLTRPCWAVGNGLTSVALLSTDSCRIYSFPDFNGIENCFITALPWPVVTIHHENRDIEEAHFVEHQRQKCVATWQLWDDILKAIHEVCWWAAQMAWQWDMIGSLHSVVLNISLTISFFWKDRWSDRQCFPVFMEWPFLVSIRWIKINSSGMTLVSTAWRRWQLRPEQTPCLALAE